MGNENRKRNLISMIIFSVIAIAIVAVSLFLAYGIKSPDNKETDLEKMLRMTNHTSQEIQNLNSALVASYNKFIEDNSNTETATIESSALLLYEDDLIIEENYESSMNDLNKLYVYYSVPEYILDANLSSYIGSGIIKLHLQSDDSSMYTKVDFVENGLSYLFYEDFENSYTLAYSELVYDFETNRPKTIHVYEWDITKSQSDSDPRHIYNVYKLNFETKDYQYYSFKLNNSASITSIYEKDIDVFKEYITHFYCYSYNMGNYNTDNNVMIRFSKYRHPQYENNFSVLDSTYQTKILNEYQNTVMKPYEQPDTTNALVLENGIDAVTYCNEKYNITIQDNVAYAQQVYGISDILINKKNSFIPLYQNGVTIDDLKFENSEFKLKEADYIYEGVNYYHNFPTNYMLNNGAMLTSLNQWLDTQYDRNKFYYQAEKFGEYYISVTNGINILKLDQNALEILQIKDETIIYSITTHEKTTTYYYFPFKGKYRNGFHFVKSEFDINLTTFLSTLSFKSGEILNIECIKFENEINSSRYSYGASQDNQNINTFYTFTNENSVNSQNFYNSACSRIYVTTYYLEPIFYLIQTENQA